ncbi:hypothetical protein DMENIID0001_079840 [Sergentomyia squamirostris]
MASLSEEDTSMKKDSLEEQSPITKEREDRIRMVRERQNEERQRKLEELKAQALAAQRFREQKEEERRKRLEESRMRDSDRRSQVEERKKAIQEAERERREYLLRKNQEREIRFEAKRRNERSSIVFAFGSSTPRLLDPGEMGTVSPSQFWNHRRATSISNIAYSGAPLTRRSSERELNEAPKKRATSATALDRQREDNHRTSNSMYEVFNWGYANDERRPRKKLQLSIAGPSINIDEPGSYDSNHDGTGIVTTNDSPSVSYRSVARRKTDLMPTVPSPRDGINYGSRSSLGSHTPRSPGRAVSMTRLDQLARPVRRNGEHISAILERERQQEHLTILSSSPSPQSRSSSDRKNMSKSMIHLASTKCRKSFPPTPPTARGSTLKLSRSMCNLAKTIGGSLKKSDNVVTALKMDSAKESVDKAGMRSGEVTPGGTLSSRPNSAMSNSTIVSSTVSRRSGVTPRKPRPASIAVTGVSLPNGTNAEGQKSASKLEKPPLPKPTAHVKKSFSVASPSLMTRSLDLSGKKSLERTPLKSRGSSKTATPLMSPGAEKEIKMPAENKVPAKEVTQKTTPAKKEIKQEIKIDEKKIEEKKIEEKKIEVMEPVKEKKSDSGSEKKDSKVIVATEEVDNKEEKIIEDDHVADESTNNVEEEDVMSNSMMSKSRITTEEEAKAALAEKRRLAREELERQAEAERVRLEQEAEAERRRIQEEEERQIQLEQETNRLAEEQRKAEEERLARAIEETRKREEEEKLQREEDARQKAERDEQEKKAREEAERIRVQTAEKHKREEIEREERRRRVEAIMSRTRAKGSVGGTPTKGNGDEKSGNGDDKGKATNSDDGGQEQTQPQTDLSEDVNSQNIPMSIDVASEKKYQMQQEQQSNYERSVTEKENSLLGSFPTTPRIVDSVNNKSSNHFHGQSLIVDDHQENAFIPDVITNNKVLNNTNENGFKSSGVENNLSSIDCTNNVVESKVLVMNQDNSKQPDSQLIDFESLPHQQQIEDVYNYNNNNDRANTTSAIPSLVTADSQENREDFESGEEDLKGFFTDEQTLEESNSNENLSEIH